MNKIDEINEYFSHCNNIGNTDDILNIIHENNIEYTENSNGIFLNISLLNKDIINDIHYLIKSTNNESITNVDYSMKGDLKKNTIEYLSTQDEQKTCKSIEVKLEIDAMMINLSKTI